MNLSRFVPLLQREWMQHQRGWWILMLAPAVLIVVAAVFGDVGMNLQVDGETEVRRLPDPVSAALASVLGLGVVTMFIAWMASLFQAPGLARRDQQDRTIEFWLSLPSSHVQSLAATLLMHLVLVPWLALAVGLAGGLLVSLLVVGKAWGALAWFGLPWGTLLAATVALSLRLALGLVLATMWLSPLILLTMAASAWLKRWGFPAVMAAIFGGGLVLDKLYGSRIVWNTLEALLEHAGQAVIAVDEAAAQRTFNIESQADLLPLAQILPGWLAQDALAALQALASPAFVLAIAVGAGCFALLVLRRRRAAM